MNEIFIAYYLLSGVCSAFFMILNENCYYSSNKALVYGIFGFLFGFIIVPIKFLKGIVEIVLELKK